MRKVFLVVEGQGDEQALPKLLHKFVKAMGREAAVFAVAQRSSRCSDEDLRRQCADLRSRDGIEGAMFVRDCEDGCPKSEAPRMAAVLRAERLPFPVAVVLLYREYETLFVAALDDLAGKRLIGPAGAELPPLDPTATAPKDPERHRDAKGQLSKFLPKTHPYRETSHQLAMTQALDVEALRATGLPCVGSLERALEFVLTSTAGSVYPPLPEAHAV